MTAQDDIEENPPKTIWEKLPEGKGRLIISFGNALNYKPLEEQAQFLVKLWEAIATPVYEKYGVMAVGGEIVGDRTTNSAELKLDVMKSTPKPA